MCVLRSIAYSHREIQYYCKILRIYNFGHVILCGSEIFGLEKHPCSDNTQLSSGGGGGGDGACSSPYCFGNLVTGHSIAS